jgi:hypothetical protein
MSHDYTARRLKETVQEDRTDEELRRKALAEAPKPWWIDPELSKKVIAEPEKYEQTGIFSTTTPYGTSKDNYSKLASSWCGYFHSMLLLVSSVNLIMT